MVVAHLADSIRTALSTQGDCNDHVLSIETGMLNRSVLRCAKRVKHLFVRIEPCRNSREERNDDGRRQHELRYPSRAPPYKNSRDRNRAKKPEQNWLVM